MALFSQDHYDLIEMFEKALRPGRTDKEPKEIWTKGNIYQDGKVNELFLVGERGTK